MLYSLNPSDIRKVIQKWEHDLDGKFIEDDWRETIVSAKNTFVYNWLRETQYKILHWSHRTPSFFNKMDKQALPFCIKCNASVGTYIHYFWKCRLVKRFRNSVAQELSKIFLIAVKKDPGLFILGSPSKTLSLKKLHFKLCDKLLFMTSRLILGWWIIGKPPTVIQWFEEIVKVLPLERISARMKGNNCLFERTWSGYLNCLPSTLEANLCYIDGIHNIICFIIPITF